MSYYYIRNSDNKLLTIRKLDPEQVDDLTKMGYNVELAESQDRRNHDQHE